LRANALLRRLHGCSLFSTLFLFYTRRARRTMKLLVALSLFASAAAVELTPDNWDDMTDGKTVLIKFLAPW